MSSHTFSSGYVFIYKLNKRERSYLFNSNTNLADNKRLVTNVIAHEIAHQLFGCLVTPQWWQNLWFDSNKTNKYEFFFFINLTYFEG